METAVREAQEANRRPEPHRPGLAPPLVREGLPLIGPAAAFNRDPLDFLLRCQRRYGDVFTVNMLLYRATFVLGAPAQQRFFGAPNEVLDLDAAIKQVLRAVVGDPKELVRLYSYPEFMAGVMRQGLGKQERLEGYIQQATCEAERTFRRWAERGEIDLFRESSRLVNFINIRALLGQEVMTAHGQAIADLYMEIESTALSVECLILPTAPLPKQRRAAKARSELVHILRSVVQERHRQKDGDDYLSLLLRQVMPDGRPIGVESIAVHLILVFFAAHTNTTGTLAWLLTFVLQNPALLARLREEQTRYCAEHGDTFGYGALKDLELLDCCMREAVRLRFCVMLIRQAAVPYAESGFTIPKGHTVCVSPILTHLDPSIYPNPHRFDPDRFADASTRRKLQRDCAYVQFGFGLHRCLGEMFANAVLKPSWSLLLRHYDLSLVDDRVSPPDWTKSLGTPFPVAPVRVRVRARTPAGRAS